MLPTVDARLQQIAQAGYRCIGHFPLPAGAWWETFDIPLEQRRIVLCQQYRDNPAWLAVVNQQQREMNLHCRSADQYGFTFYVAQVQDV